MEKEVVLKSYQAIAKRYHQRRLNRELPFSEWLDNLSHYFPSAGKILDAGCGGGVPVSKYFHQKSYQVQGFDLSPEMIKLAKKAVPGASFQIGDLEEMELPPSTFEMIVSFYAIIHVPREKHYQIFQNFFRFLKPGGILFVTLGTEDQEQILLENWHGAPMYWSHYDARTGFELIQKAGFDLLFTEIDDSRPENKHSYIIARKPESGSQTDAKKP